MKDINEKMLEILEDIEFEEVPLSEIELARIKKMQIEQIEKERLRVKREKRRRVYTGIVAGFVVALGIAFFMRGGQDGESHIATEDEGGMVRITDFEGEGLREEIENNGIKRSTNIEEAIDKIKFNAMVPRIKEEEFLIEEITTSDERLTILYSYKGKVITFVTSSNDIYSYVKKSESINIAGIDIKKGKSGLGEEYAFKKGEAYFNISIIGTLDKTFLEKFIKSIK